MIPYDSEFDGETEDAYDASLLSLPQNKYFQAARLVIDNLRDRRGIKRGFENIDLDTRKEIVATLAAIIQSETDKTEENAS